MKTLITILASLLILNNSYSQALIPFPDSGTKQGCIYVGDWTTNFHEYNASITYLYDTIHNSFIYSRFHAEHFSDFYTRYDNGKIYKIEANFDGSFAGQDILQYDFSLNLNDTFPSQQLGALRVDSVSTITLLNGQTRKFMKLVGATQWTSSYKYYWIDGIGDIKMGFLYPSDFEGGHGVFVCHWNNTGLVYKKQPVIYNCDTLINVTGISKIYFNNKLGDKIYPNPNNGIFQLFINNITGNLKFELFNINGKFISQCNNFSLINSTTINFDISNIQKGFYVLKILNDGNITYEKILIY